MRLWKLIAVAAALLLASWAFAQSWPQKPVRLIVPFPPGGATDIAARLLGEKLAQTWGQSVVIENRGGGGGSLGAPGTGRAAPGRPTAFLPSCSGSTPQPAIFTQLQH